MSNRSGDLYRCSDPDCGCEVEVRRPSDALSANGASAGGSGAREIRIDDGLEKSDSAMEMVYVRADEAHLPPPVSGNGLDEPRTSAGTSGGNTTATSGSHSRAESSGREEMRCFCGAEMRDTGTTVRNARVATMKL
jgi:hypothetical protein